MNWVYELADDAEQELRKFPQAIQRNIVNTLIRSQSDPFQGDVIALHGSKHDKIFRRRIGNYRILFVPDYEKRLISVLHISLRSEKTYR